MTTQSSKSIILFRFHDKFEIARERIKILRYYNPEVPIYGLYGGLLSNKIEAQEMVDMYLDHFWTYREERDKDWKWMHTDLMTKAWFRDFGHGVRFDYLYSYEYDLLTLAPLVTIYPLMKDGEIALSAAEAFTKDIEDRWYWTSKEPSLSRYKEFCEYMKATYGLGRQKQVCLGPGPLLSREFIEKYSAVKDVDFMHEEINIPAFAEVFDIKVKNNGMHPGFFTHSSEDKYFNCMENKHVQWSDITEAINAGHARRSFHPVKSMVTLNDILKLLKTEVL